MRKPCNDCPFVVKNERQGSFEWLEDVLTHHRQNPYFSHTCHKTDPKADGFVGGKKIECAGHLTMMVNEMDKTPGKGGVYNSIRDLAAAYLKDFGVDVGNAELKP